MALEKNSDRLGLNILTLRHRLKMTQSEFIKVFFRNPDGSPMFSVAKLSNIETKGCSDPEQITNVLSEKLGIPPSVFHLRPVEFSSVIDSLLKDENSVSKIHFFPSEDSPTVRQTYSSNILEVLSDYIAKNITAGKLHASDRLPGDRTLAELLGVSRSAVREALKVLSAIGVVNILPGSGVYLAKNTRDIFTLPFSWTTLLSADSNNNIYELRVLIERETVRLATEQHREQVTNFLRPLIEYEGAMLEAENYAEIHKCDTNFHMGIATCAGNELLTDLLFICRKILSFLNALGTSTPNQILALHAEHSRVFYAIEQGDSEAAQKLIVDHLKRAEQRYMGLH